MLRRIVLGIVLCVVIFGGRPSPLAITVLRDGDAEAREWAFDAIQARWPAVQCYAPTLPREKPFDASDRLFHELVAGMLEDGEWGTRSARVLSCIRAPGNDERVVRCAAGIRVDRMTAHICHELILAVADPEALALLARYMMTAPEDVRGRLAFGFRRIGWPLVREAAELHDRGAL